MTSGRRRRVLTSVVLGAWLLLASASATGYELESRYLDGYHGPYRGLVIDAETKTPLAGAAAVAVWTREVVYPLHSSTRGYRVREVLTAEDGTFEIDARDLEEGAPRRTLRPYFVIFFRGYAPLQGRYGGKFERPGAIAELRPVTCAEQRRLGDRIDPYGLSETPFRELPNLMRLLNAHRADCGLNPYTAETIP